MRKIGLVYSQENYRNCCHLMSDFKAKKAPNSISAGALPQTPLGELALLPRLPADPIPALGTTGLKTTCLPKYVSINPLRRDNTTCRHPFVAYFASFTDQTDARTHNESPTTTTPCMKVIWTNHLHPPYRLEVLDIPDADDNKRLQRTDLLAETYRRQWQTISIWTT